MAPKFTSMAVSTCDEFFSLPRGAATRSATSCSQFTFQTANFKLPLSNSQASSPVLFVEAPGRPVFLRFVCPLAKARGMARQGAQPFVLSARGPSRDRGAPLGAPPRQACAVRAYLRASSLRRRPRFSWPPKLGRPPSAKLLAGGPYWPPGGAPAPPGCVLARHARGRRIRLHHQDASR